MFSYGLPKYDIEAAAMEATGETEVGSKREGPPAAPMVFHSRPRTDSKSTAPTMQDEWLSSVVWAMTGLSNGPHTIVNSNSAITNGELDAFIYTVQEPDDVPPAPAGSTNVFLSADAFTYSEGWANSTGPVPSCIKSGHVHTASVVNSTFSFNFTGDQLFLNMLASSSGGQLALSINDEEPQTFSTTAPTDSCALLNLNVTTLLKRSLARRGANATAAENRCTGKTVSGQPAIDGATRVSEAGVIGRAWM
ncbi:hypothetical protein B0H14DRAFT_2569672 [Mycena olivaceomarginata]|nr:hypothetical protein B0H14DRAFT_2569672 [Mycena olivaceomarginata]